MAGEITIRLAGEGDMPAIAGLTNETIERSWAHFATRPVTVEETLARWAEARALHAWLVAEEAGDGGPSFMGFARASPWKSRGAYAWTTETSVYLPEAARGRGLGRRLYTVLFEILRQQGYLSAIGGIAMPNDASVRLHEWMGMRLVGDFERIGWKAGAWRAVRYYQIDLNEPTGEEPALPRPVADVAPGVLARLS